MKLYQADLSPFAARVRMQVYAKGLDGNGVELSTPPGGTGSDEYKSLNPTGKIPALDTGTRVLPESEVICEYLEDVFPTPALRPESAEDRAQARLLSRFVDIYLYPRMAPLYGQLDPGSRDEAFVAEGMAALDEGLAIAERLLTDGGYQGGPFAVGKSLSLADCALVTGFFFTNAVLPMLGRSPALAGFELLSDYWNAASAEPVATRILQEMQVALQEMMQSQG
jgi:glutathione S-transferase